jgi:O-antigen/teichoic acid export membrane protein
MSPDSERKIFTLLFSIAAGVSCLKAALYASLLSPSELGGYTICGLIVSLATYFASAGMLEGMVSVIPLMQGRGESTKAVRESLLSTLIVTGSVVASILTISEQVLLANGVSFPGSPMLGAYFLVCFVFSGMLCDLQGQKRSVLYTVLLIARSALPTLLLASAPFKVSASDSMLAEILVISVIIALVKLKVYREFVLVSDLSLSIKALSRVGVPFTIGSLVNNLSNNLDKWAVQFAFGNAQLGQYVFASNIVIVGNTVHNMFSLYSTPRILQRFSATRNESQLHNDVLRVTFYSACIIAIIVGFLVVTKSFWIAALFPQYLSAGGLIIWMGISALIVGVSFSDIIFRAYGLGKNMLRYQLAVVFILSVCLYCSTFLDCAITHYAIVAILARSLVPLLCWRKVLFGNACAKVHHGFGE